MSAFVYSSSSTGFARPQPPDPSDIFKFRDAVVCTVYVSVEQLFAYFASRERVKRAWLRRRAQFSVCSSRNCVRATQKLGCETARANLRSLSSCVGSWEVSQERRRGGLYCWLVAHGACRPVRDDSIQWRTLPFGWTSLPGNAHSRILLYQTMTRGLRAME